MEARTILRCNEPSCDNFADGHEYPEGYSPDEVMHRRQVEGSELFGLEVIRHPGVGSVGVGTTTNRCCHASERTEPNRQ